MSELEVLLVTMKKDEISFLKKTNLNSDIIIANQNGKNSKEVFEHNGNNITLINTDTVGVGINRNIALMYSKADICLLADDDEIFRENYKENILSEFNNNPKADIIIFNVNMLEDDSTTRINKSVLKVNKFNYSNYGAVRIAFRRESILKYNIWFSSKFGGGADYSSGEDSLFLKEAIDKGLKIYTSPIYIADIEQGTSSWFYGYTYKYFYDKGAYLKLSSPILKNLYIFYYAYKFRNASKFNFRQLVKIMYKGNKDF